MKSGAVFSYRPTMAPDGMEWRAKKAGTSPLAAKKLNFYFTSGLAGKQEVMEFEADLANHATDNQYFTGKEWNCTSMNTNNIYNLKNFQFGHEISKKRPVFSKNFQLFPVFFQLFPIDFQFMVARGTGWRREFFLEKEKEREAGLRTGILLRPNYPEMDARIIYPTALIYYIYGASITTTVISRRNFIRGSALAASTLSLLEWLEPASAAVGQAHIERLAGDDPQKVAGDEDFWNWIREQYTISPNIINLNNGGVSPQPKPVQDAHIRNYQMCNEGPSYFMWRILDQGREPLRARLAELAGCSPDELAINRNTTEGLNSIIFGLNLKAGDEVLLTRYDYPNMTNAWKQREKRDGIKLNWVELDLPVESDEVFLKAYEKAITPKTKIVHVTHIMNWTGQILPARKIADMAHAKGCEVLVDASHSFVHIDYKISDLDCDYYATSLHKWLCAPFGTGFMFIKKEKIKNVWALLSAPEPDSAGITKFENLGTRSFAAEMAIGNAIDFQMLIGSKRKEERLRFLKNYWCEKVKNIPQLKFYTSLKPEYSCGIATFGMQGWEPGEIPNFLFEKKKIHVTNVDHEAVKGCRVSPHVYTSLRDLDQLVEVIHEMAETGPPKK